MEGVNIYVRKYSTFVSSRSRSRSRSTDIQYLFETLFNTRYILLGYLCQLSRCKPRLILRLHDPETVIFDLLPPKARGRAVTRFAVELSCTHTHTRTHQLTPM